MSRRGWIPPSHWQRKVEGFCSRCKRSIYYATSPVSGEMVSLTHDCPKTVDDTVKNTVREFGVKSL